MAENTEERETEKPKAQKPRPAPRVYDDWNAPWQNPRPGDHDRRLSGISDTGASE